MNMFDNGELDITNTIEKEYIDKYKEKEEAVYIEEQRSGTTSST